MKYLIPIDVTPARLVSSNVAEDDAPAWDAGTTYAVGAAVVRAHRVWESLVAGNVGNVPEETAGTAWLDLGATNRWAMFDEVVGTQTAADDAITVRLGAIGIVRPAIALLNLEASHVRVRAFAGAETLYDQTFSLVDSTSITSWYAYFFEPYQRATTFTWAEAPLMGGGELELTISDAAGGTVKCGSCVVGQMREVGRAMNYGARVGIDDFSRKSRDAWGNYSVTEGRWSRRSEFEFWVDRAEVDLLVRELAALRARAAVYIGSDWYESALVYGFYKSFDVVISGPVMSLCSIQIEGLT